MYPEAFPIGERRGWGAALAALVLGLLAVGAAALALWLHNGLVAKREAVDAAWAQVQSNYLRRAELVPGLVEALDRLMRHESETFEQVVERRNEGLERFAAASRELLALQQSSSRALEATGRPPADAARLAEVEAAQVRVGRGIRGLLQIAESYPELRAADSFLELQAQLEGSENRINVARMGFNEAVRDYNAALEQLPTRAIARFRGFQRRAYFEVDAGVRRAPSLDFD